MILIKQKEKGTEHRLKILKRTAWKKLISWTNKRRKKKSVSLENKGGIIHRDKKITSQLMGRNNRLMVSKPRNYKLRL